MNSQQNKDRRFDPDSSLAAFTENPVTDILKTSFTLTGYLDGFATLTGYSEKYGCVKHYAINSSLLSLYAIAFPELADMPTNRVAWNVKDKYAFVPDDETWDAWKQTHTYSLEFVTPAALSDRVAAMIKQTLDHYFGLTTGFEERDMPCLALTAGSRFNYIPAATKQFTNTLNETGVVKELYGSSQQLCDFLNLHLPAPVVNSLPGELVHISLHNEPVTLDNISRWLASYGLELNAAVQKMQVFSITDAR